MLIPYSVQIYGSWFFYYQQDKVSFLCPYGFWFHITTVQYSQREMQHIFLRLLIQYSQGDEATVLDHV